jgi:hypothetical protein
MVRTSQSSRENALPPKNPSIISDSDQVQYFSFVDGNASTRILVTYRLFLFYLIVNSVQVPSTKPDRNLRWHRGPLVLSFDEIWVIKCHLYNFIRDRILQLKERAFMAQSWVCGHYRCDLASNVHRRWWTVASRRRRRQKAAADAATARGKGGGASRRLSCGGGAHKGPLRVGIGGFSQRWCPGRCAAGLFPVAAAGALGVAAARPSSALQQPSSSSLSSCCTMYLYSLLLQTTV